MEKNPLDDADLVERLARYMCRADGNTGGFTNDDGTITSIEDSLVTHDALHVARGAKIVTGVRAHPLWHEYITMARAGIHFMTERKLRMADDERLLGEL